MTTRAEAARAEVMAAFESAIEEMTRNVERLYELEALAARVEAELSGLNERLRILAERIQSGPDRAEP